MRDAERKPRRRRAYNSPRRAAKARETRARISAAARACFLENGFARTRMRDVAARAQVSEATVYLSFPSKAVLFSDVMRSAIRGPAPATPLVESPDWQALASLPGERLIARFAVLIERVLHDAAPLLAIGAAAAFDDPQLRELQDRGRAAELETLKGVVETLRTRGELAPDLTVERATDIVYALAGGTVYLRLTGDRSWSREDYIAWLTDALTHELLEAPKRAAHCT